MINHASSPSRRRMFLLVLPLLALPFLALAFRALGGGQAPAPSPVTSHRLNLAVPAPHLEKQARPDKLDLYRQAGRSLPDDGENSIDRLLKGLKDFPVPADASARLQPETGLPASAPHRTPENQEAQIEERLAQLTTLVAQPPAHTTAPAPAPRYRPALQQPPATDVDRLENLLQGVAAQGNAPDPELQQLQGMLDRILDIQHPERVARRLQQEPGGDGQQVLPVRPPSGQATVTLLQKESPAATFAEYKQGGLSSPPAAAERSRVFYGLPSDSLHLAPTTNSLAADIQQEQRLYTGSTVRIRLRQDTYLAGRRLPRGTTVSGTCRLRGERLFISVTTIRDGALLLPVSLAAHDLDGLEGLFVPGLLRQQAGTQGADRLVSQQAGPPLAPTFGAQAVAAGVETAKRLLSGRIRRLHVTLPAGHRLLLLDRQATR